MNAPYTNIPEDELEITHTIYDKVGNAYTIEEHLSPSRLISYVCSKKGCVGRISWDTSTPGIMVIWDLIIIDPPDIKPWWARLFPFLRKQPISYKGRGLGSAMLRYIIESGYALGVSEISGWITSDDLQATPYLPQFYRQHGFTVRDNLNFYQVLNRSSLPVRSTGD